MRARAFGSIVALALCVLALSGFAGCFSPDYRIEGDAVEKGPSVNDAGATQLHAPVTPSPSPTLQQGVPCDVAHVLRTRCLSCHGSTPSYGAPMALVTLEDLLAPSKVDPARKVYERVALRIADEARPMPPPPNRPLDARDQQTLASWASVKAPASSETCQASMTDGGAPSTKPLSCTPDTPLAPSTAFAMPAASQDLYVCYGVNIPVLPKKHITAIAPRIDNKAIVHHVLLMASPNVFPTTPTVCGPEATAGARLLAAWAPGGGATELPPEAGFPIEGAGRYVVQVHYSNTQNLMGQTDRSGFELCTTTTLRTFDADVIAFGTESFVLPPRVQMNMLCAVAVPLDFPPVKVFGALPHMHRLGTSIATSRSNVTGTSDLGSEANWDFQLQPWKALNTTISPGDVVTTRCGWKNTTNAVVGFGENTADEMCYSFTAYYPRILKSGFTWNAPASTSKCVPF